MAKKIVNAFAIAGCAAIFVGAADILVHFVFFLLHWDPYSLLLPAGICIFAASIMVDSDIREKEEMQKRIDQIMKEEGWPKEDDD